MRKVLLGVAEWLTYAVAWVTGWLGGCRTKIVEYTEQWVTGWVGYPLGRQGGCGNR